MSLENKLQGGTVWITRPEGQADDLLRLLSERGATPVHLPMLAIEAIPADRDIMNRILDLDSYELLVFISTNAASIGMRLINDYWPLFPAGLSVFAVGSSTASVLEQYGLAVEYPREQMSSEALLALPALQDITDKRALIVRGEGGREVLADGLREKGASVDYLELYKRKPPEYEDGFAQSMLNESIPAAIIVTGSEALANLRSLFHAHLDKLLSVPLFVSSERIKSDAVESGFSRVVTMSGADDQAIMTSLTDNL